MFKIYLKQAIALLKQNPFISVISILGTALAIMMIMSVIVADEIKAINMAPEINRDKTLHIDYQVKKDTIKGSWQSGLITYDIVKNYIHQMKTPKYITVMNKYDPSSSSLVNKEGSTEYLTPSLRFIDASFWEVFQFDFIEGKAFDEEEFKAGVANAILSESISKKLFSDESALGKNIELSFKKYKITGIVKDVSPVFNYAAGDIWIPYTSMTNYENYRNFLVLLVAANKNEFPKIVTEVREQENFFNIDHSPWLLYLCGPKDPKTAGTIQANDAKQYDEMVKVDSRKMIIVFTLLLLIPALNLSGFSLSRIKKRTAEIGIRKAFGAKKYIILIQVLYENMITSLIGGVIGLILSYLVVIWLKSWLLGVPEGADIPAGAMLSGWVFLAVFLVCLVLNLLSAGLSAFRASRMNIVDALNQKLN